MAKRNTKTVGTVDHKKPIPRSYDPYEMEKRIYDLEKNAGGGGGGTTVNPFDYSKDEKEIGTWIDGTTKVYRKVFDLGAGQSVSAGSWSSLNVDTTGITKIVGASLIGYGADGTYTSGMLTGSIYKTSANGCAVRVLNNESIKFVILDYIKG